MKIPENSSVMEGKDGVFAPGMCRECESARRDEYYAGTYCKMGCGNIDRYVSEGKKNPFCPMLKK